MRGGLALRNPEKYTEIANNKEKYAAAINEMIAKSVQIQCLTYDSLSGFIFEVKVNETDVVFNNLDALSEFNKPVTTILLKLVVISDPVRSADFNFNGKLVNKNTMTPANFHKEIEEQYNIYKKTLAYNNMPICPSIIYDNIITNEAEIQEYLTTLVKNTISIEGRLLNIMKQIFNQNKSIKKASEKMTLGIIGMEFADGYEELSATLNRLDEHKKVKREILQSPICETTCKICASVIVNLIRLFISCGIVHLDLHSGNIMVNNTLEKSTIIDFGVLQKITNTAPFAYDGNIVKDKSDYFFYEESTGKPSINALNKYMRNQFGSSFQYIGNGEQIFMQHYLYNVRDVDERCKKILKLFLLILVCERQVNYARFSEPLVQTLAFLDLLGLNIEMKTIPSTLKRLDKFRFDVDSLDNPNVSLDQWINNESITNIRRSYRVFFKNIMTQVCTTLKDYYQLQNFENETDPVIRIGLEPEESEKYKKETVKYLYSPAKGGSKKGKTRNKRDKRNKRNKRKTRKYRI